MSASGTTAKLPMSLNPEELEVSVLERWKRIAHEC
jgi:hypothetical protein